MSLDDDDNNDDIALGVGTKKYNIIYNSMYATVEAIQLRLIQVMNTSIYSCFSTSHYILDF